MFWHGIFYPFVIIVGIWSSSTSRNQCYLQRFLNLLSSSCSPLLGTSSWTVLPEGKSLQMYMTGFFSVALKCISRNPITKPWAYILTNARFEGLLNRMLRNDGVHISERFSGINSKSSLQLLDSKAAVICFTIIIIHVTCFFCWLLFIKEIS